MQKEIPILFNTDMVHALLRDGKSQTRRAANPQPDWDQEVKSTSNTGPFYWPIGSYGQQCGLPIRSDKYGESGDLFYVRETWGMHPEAGYYYKAGSHFVAQGAPIWKPSIHLPKEGSRLWLEKTEGRFQRLQGITENDALAEGIVGVTKDGKLYKYGVADSDGYPGGGTLAGWPWSEFQPTAVEAFRKLWDSINGRRVDKNGVPLNWDANPWVFVEGFRTLSKTGHPYPC